MDLRAAVITVSDRAASWVYLDRSGPVLAAGLRELGYEVADPQVVPDGDHVTAALRQAVAAKYDVIITTGGTGLSPQDKTPQATEPVLDYQVPGIAEQLRASAIEAGVSTACLSRGVAGVAGASLVINVPGSPEACRHAMGVLREILSHAVAQLHGASDGHDSHHKKS